MCGGTIDLIDGDSIIWSIAYNCRAEDSIDKKKVDKIIDRYMSVILRNTNATSYIGFLQSSTIPGFRYNIYPEYKAQRPEIPDFYITHSSYIRQSLIDKWKFIEVFEIESDDALSICAEHFRRRGKPHIICGIDKDLDQIPGDHYNYRKHTHNVITEKEAERNLYTQLLLGDTVDNIKGCPGIGKVKAKEIIDSATQKLKIYDGREITVLNPIHQVVLNAFVDTLGVHQGINEFTLNFNLVYLLRSYDGFNVPEPVLFE